MDIREKILAVRKAAYGLSSSTDEMRNMVLGNLRTMLEKDSGYIFAENHKDLAVSDPSKPIYSRLKFDDRKMGSSLESISQIMLQEDPIGKVLAKRKLDDGIILEKTSFPIGVIGMIFEARPDALLQIVSLAIKSGNGIILKGGKEAVNSNRALMESVKKSFEGTGISPDCVLLLETHEDVDMMLKMDGFIDLIIPRGSNSFVRYVMEHTSIPVLGHADGVCSIYISETADKARSVDLVFDAKTQYPSACNAVEHVLVNRKIADEIVPLLDQRLREKNVIIHGDDKVCSILHDAVPMTDDDLHREYLGYEMLMMTVDSIDDAIEHINRYGSHHTDCILTEDENEKRKFTVNVDSADVFVNLSTRFADGYRFGLGAEVGISTSRIHARGPVGIEGLMTSRYLVRGDYSQVADYVDGRKHFSFQEIR